VQPASPAISGRGPMPFEARAICDRASREVRFDLALVAGNRQEPVARLAAEARVDDLST
jgi:hypothetical protein